MKVFAESSHVLRKFPEKAGWPARRLSAQKASETVAHYLTVLHNESGEGLCPGAGSAALVEPRSHRFRGMNHLNFLRLFVLLIVGMIGIVSRIGPSAAGQTPNAERQRSHGQIPSRGLRDLSQFLPERLEQARQTSQVQDLLHKGMENPRFLQEEWRQSKPNPELEAALKALVESQRDGRFQLDPNHPLVKQLEKMFESQPGGDRLPLPVPNEQLWSDLKRM